MSLLPDLYQVDLLSLSNLLIDLISIDLTTNWLIKFYHSIDQTYYQSIIILIDKQISVVL